MDFNCGPRKSTKALLAFVLIALLCTTAGADTVVLKNGGKLRGKIESENEKEVVLNVANMGTVTVQRRRIEKIIKDERDGTPLRLRGQAGPADEQILEKLRGWTNWYGIYFQGRKVGCIKMSLRIRSSGGEKTFVSLGELHMKLAVAGEKKDVTGNTESRFSAKPPYRLLYRRYTRHADNQSMVVTGTAEGDRFKLSVVINNRKQERTMDRPNETFLDFLEGAALALKGAKIGDRIKYWTFNVEKGENEECTAEVTAIEDRISRGVKLKVYTVSESVGNVKFISRYSSQGQTLQAAMGSFTLRLEDEKLAKDFGYNMDMLLDNLIRTNRIGKRPQDVKYLKARISGLTGKTVINSDRQRFEQKGPHLYEVTVTSDKAPGPITELGLDKDLLRRYLGSTPYIQADNQEIVKTARQIVGNEKDLYKKAVRISQWVYHSIKKSFTTDQLTALDVLKTRSGDCTEHTILFVALARAVGIPARSVSGIMYCGDEMPAFAFHAWPEIYVGKWVGLDPAWNEPLIDATHIKLGHSSRSTMQLMGRLKIQILESR